MAGSEIARILRQIRQEEESAKRGLGDYAVVSQHAFITARTENIARYTREIVNLVGSEQTAMALIITNQENVADEDRMKGNVHVSH